MTRLTASRPRSESLAHTNDESAVVLSLRRAGAIQHAVLTGGSHGCSSPQAVLRVLFRGGITDGIIRALRLSDVCSELSEADKGAVVDRIARNQRRSPESGIQGSCEQGICCRFSCRLTPTLSGSRRVNNGRSRCPSTIYRSLPDVLLPFGRLMSVRSVVQIWPDPTNQSSLTRLLIVPPTGCVHHQRVRRRSTGESATSTDRGGDTLLHCGRRIRRESRIRLKRTVSRPGRIETGRCRR